MLEETPQDKVQRSKHDSSSGIAVASRHAEGRVVEDEQQSHHNLDAIDRRRRCARHAGHAVLKLQKGWKLMQQEEEAAARDQCCSAARASATEKRCQELNVSEVRRGVAVVG